MANDRKYQDLADCMRANAARFAAYKANYVRKTLDSILANEKLSSEQRQEHAAQAMSLFHHWGDAERNFAVQSAQMAQKWQDFAADGDEYLLQYRTAMDDKVREEHAILQGTTLPPSDPFWDKYYPPLGWNCRCTVVQVRRGKYQESDSAKACELGESSTANTPSFRFNPGKAKIAFPDGVSYFRHADENTQHKVIAIARANNRANYEEINKVIEYDNTTITIDKISVYEISKGGASDKTYFYKQEILLHFENYIDKLSLKNAEPIDLSHNNPRNMFFKRKKQFIQMNVYRLEVNGYEYVIKMGVYSDSTLNLYSITDITQ